MSKIFQVKKHPHKFDKDVLFLGDIHGDMGSIFMIEESNVEIDIIQVGDFGLFSVDHKWLAKLQRILEGRKITLHAIKGNHDADFVWEEKSEEISKKYNRINLIQNYTEIKIGELKCLCVGGGVSIDRFFRTPFKNYCHDEQVVYNKVEEKYDALICHSAPSYFNKVTPNEWWFYDRDPMLKGDLLKERKIIDDIASDIDCEIIIGGHYHNNSREYRYMNGKEMKYRCLDIDEICSFKTLFK